MFHGVIAICKNNQILYNKAFGTLNNTSDTLINENTLFYIASVSKQFTAMCIMLLQESGNLEYDDPATNYLPNLKSLPDHITIRHLLTHTAGLSDRNYYALKNPTNEDVLQMIGEMTVADFGSSGVQFSYSNTGYILLAAIIEHVTGSSIDIFLEEAIFSPLGMDRTTCSKTKWNTENNKVQPYNIIGTPADHHAVVIGPAGIYSCLKDLIIWNQALNNNTLVSAETKEEAFAYGNTTTGPISYTLNDLSYGYGFGWSPFTQIQKQFVQHDGSTEGYRSLIRKNRTDSVDIIMLTNHGGAFAMGEITTGIDEILFGGSFKEPETPLAIEVVNALRVKNIETVRAEMTTRISSDNAPDERILGRLGFTYQNENRMKEAIGLFKWNASLHPLSTNALYALGEAYIKNQQFKEAKKTYTKYLAVKPDSEHARSRLHYIDNQL